MAKNNRGGKRTVAAPVTPQPTPDDQEPATPVPQPKQITYSKFRTMTDDEKADQIVASIKGGVPDHLAKNDFQKFLYNTKLNDKPQVLDDTAFAKAKGKDLYRTVNQVFDRQNDISYTAPQIANQIMNGTYTRVSDTGGSFYGRGLYFDQSKRGSAGYGRYSGDVNKTAMIYAKLAPNAKTITYSSALSAVQKEIKSGSKLGKALGKIKAQEDQASIWALSKGYAALTSGTSSSEYHNVIDRSYLIINKNVTSI